MPRNASPPVRLLSALLVSVLTGLLLAAAAFPLVGSIGLTAKARAEEFLVLPAQLGERALNQRSRILASDGSLLAVLYKENRVEARLQEVPELTRKALIAIEDSRFYAHDGIDYKGTLRAAVQNAKAGGVSQGGSTLTQQYVKNALLQGADAAAQKAAVERSFNRKLKEARYALAIERQLTKDQILERYLNIAYFGNGVYGIGTAANFYFGKPVKGLTLSQGATLAGIVQSPGRFDPVKAQRDKAVRTTLLTRRNTVLARMRDLGYITEPERAKAAAEQGTAASPLFRISPVVSGCENPAVKAPYFCDYLRRTLEADTPLGNVLGKTVEERQSRLLGGGLTIQTTLDPVRQADAQAAVDETVPPADDFGAGAAVNMVEPGTGAVKAMALNRRYTESKAPGNTKVNLAIGGSSGFQGGSTFKAFVLADAIRQGIPLGLTLYAPAHYTSSVFKNYTKNGIEPYSIDNAGDSEAGTFDLRSATHDSVNTYFLQLEERTGIEGPAALAEDMGVRQFAGGSPSAPLPRNASFVLGTNEVSPLSMAAAYATFAARGLYCAPRPVTAIFDSARTPIPLPPQSCKQVLEQPVADTVNSVLSGVIDGGTRGRTGASASIGRPAAGKTGTTNGSRAAWFVGYTPQLATSVWVGDPGAPGREVKQMRFVTIGGRYYRQVYGGTIPARIWRRTMQAAVAGLPVVGFESPDRSTVQGQEIAVPDVSGLPLDVAEQELVAAGFAVRSGGSVSAAPVPRGQAAYTSPRAGRTRPFGSTVTLFRSNGRRASSGYRSPAPDPFPTAAGVVQPPPVIVDPSPSPTKRKGR